MKSNILPFLVGVIVGWILIPMLFASPLARKRNGG